MSTRMLKRRLLALCPIILLASTSRITSEVSSLTENMFGLSNVDYTSDASNLVSIAAQKALHGNELAFNIVSLFMNGFSLGANSWELNLDTGSSVTAKNMTVRSLPSMY